MSDRAAISIMQALPGRSGPSRLAIYERPLLLLVGWVLFLAFILPEAPAREGPVPDPCDALGWAGDSG